MHMYAQHTTPMHTQNTYKAHLRIQEEKGLIFQKKILGYEFYKEGVSL